MKYNKLLKHNYLNSISTLNKTLIKTVEISPIPLQPILRLKKVKIDFIYVFSAVKMDLQIVIAGESQCEEFAKVCLIADYLAQNLPLFCYKRIEISVLEWKTWLFKINVKNKWHHHESPLVWKELLMEGSSPYYIGGASDFLDYCYSYYEFESFLSSRKLKNLLDNSNQFAKIISKQENNLKKEDLGDELHKDFAICISGASHPLTMYLISRLLDISFNNKSITKIYIYDKNKSETFLEYMEKECSYVGTNFAGKVVRHTNKMGIGLTNCDLLIIMDYMPLSGDISIGDWLYQNAEIMKNLAPMINASASHNMYIVLPNLGPACYNATLLTKILTNIISKNVVVVTSDLGLELSSILAEIAEVPMEQMFCPPVWGFVGINHLVDVKNTIHKYEVFDPFTRYIKVKNSSLCIGNLTPEFRTLEYLLHFNENIWRKLAETKRKSNSEDLSLNKVIAIINFIRIWLSGPNPNDIISLGILCDGTFGLTFDGVFSQPAKFKDGFWQPASGFMAPKDAQMRLSYLEQIAKQMVILKKGELPDLTSYNHCTFYLKKRKKKAKDSNLKKKTTFLND